VPGQRVRKYVASLHDVICAQFFLPSQWKVDAGDSILAGIASNT
jgi:hypothetical protein